MEREALKLALEALEEAQTNDDGMEKWDRNERAIAAIKEALVQPAQEPYDQTALELCNVCGWKTLIPDDGCLNCERKAQPVQRPWVGLTNAERHTCTRSPFETENYRAIEAKLKEKNNG